MLQVNTQHPQLALVNQAPREYASVGSGQCAFDDGTFKAYRFSPRTCPNPKDCPAPATPCSLDQCKADCDAEPSECIAIGYYQDHCFEFAPKFGDPLDHYVKTTDEFTHFECYAVVEPFTTTSTTTTTITTTTTTLCVPYSEDACRNAALGLNLTPGGAGAEFASDHKQKGCYTYTSGQYKGFAYYGTVKNPVKAQDKLSKKINQFPTKTKKFRVPGYDCQACVPYSQAACLRAAMLAGLKIGGGGHNFASNSHTQKGCYTYTFGTYKDRVYYGSGAEEADKSAPITSKDGKIRPAGYDCGPV